MSNNVWSVARVEGGVVVSVAVMSSQQKAMNFALGVGGDLYLVRGTQIADRPLGAVEEHIDEATWFYVE